MYRGLRYHLGSLAIGSFIMTLVKILQAIMVFIEAKLKEAASENAMLGCIIKCAHCCLACIKRMVEYINLKVYIQIALTGNSFCNAAYEAFCLVAENILRFAICESISDVFEFIGAGIFFN